MFNVIKKFRNNYREIMVEVLKFSPFEKFDTGTQALSI